MLREVCQNKIIKTAVKSIKPFLILVRKNAQSKRQKNKNHCLGFYYNWYIPLVIDLLVYFPRTESDQ